MPAVLYSVYFLVTIDDLTFFNLPRPATAATAATATTATA